MIQLDATEIASPRRRANRRGEGGRLREELIRAATALVESEGVRQLSLRSVARAVGIAATSVYLHFPDLDALLGAVVARGFDELTAATNAAAAPFEEPAQQLRARCRAYCRFGLERPRLYEAMFQIPLPHVLASDPTRTPGRRSFENLVDAVRRCCRGGLTPPHDDAFRLASLIWASEHGLILAQTARPSFPWAPIESLVKELVDALMGFDQQKNA